MTFVPVIAEPGQPLDDLPRLGRIVGKDLLRNHHMQQHMQRRLMVSPLAAAHDRRSPRTGSSSQ